MARFADGVHPWRPRQGRDDRQAFGFEHLSERGGEPRRAGSPWILLCPHAGFFRAIRTISVLIDTLVDGRWSMVDGRPGRLRSV
jgi:hypothetical protein